MATDKCAGCTNKYGFFERSSICPECHRSFCQSCLPYKGKKVKKSQPQVSLEPCVYCKRQKPINKAEEAEILSNFQERYYDKAHIDRPIQSKLRLDKVMGQNPSPTQERKGGGVPLSEEDRALEERLKKLKEPDKKVNIPSYTESEMREKLEKLRGEGGGGSDGQDDGGGQGGGGGQGDGGGGGGEGGSGGGHGDGSGGGGGGGGGSRSNEEERRANYDTQTEQADRLMEQASDEVRIDERVGEARDEDLLRRFQELKGGGSSTTTSASAAKERPKVELDIQQLLEDMEEDPAVPDEDPEKLLRDLQAFQSKEEAAAMQALNSDGIQNLVEEGRRLAAEEQGGGGLSSGDPLAGIVYPKLPGPEDHQGEVPMETGSDAISKESIVRMLEEGREELRQEEEQEQENRKFIHHTSERLDQLRGGEGGGDHMMSHDLPDDEVVKSKPKSTAGPRMDFSWSHFGTEPAAASNLPSSVVNSAARQLGVLDDGDFPGNENGEEFDQEVQGLIARMLEEAELENRLEASGLNYSTTEQEPNKSASKPSSGGGGATSLPPPPAPLASPHAAMATARGGGGGACGVDDLPWCCICNDDATLRCYDCDDDLYCQRCFSEGHQQFGLYDHQYAPFEQPHNK